MPDIITHYIFAKEAKKEMPQELSEMINHNQSMYDVGSNGPDYFFYYHVLPYQIDKDRHEITQYGSKMHGEHINEMFTTMFSYLKEHYSDSLYAYVLGFVMHYELDRYCHPFIFYWSGIDDGTSEARIYGYYHKQMEIAIDQWMLEQREHNSISECKPADILDIEKCRFDILYPMVKEIIEGVYGGTISHEAFVTCFKDFKSAMKLVYSTGHLKKSLCAKIEKLLGKGPFFSTAVYSTDYSDYDVLNLEKKTWLDPCDDTVKSNNTFIDQFELGLADARDFVIELNQYLHDEIDLDVLLKRIGGRCFDTNHKEDVPKKYFDCIYEGEKQ